MNNQTEIETFETTIGELIEVLSNIAAEHTDNEQEQYLLTSQAFDELVNSQNSFAD